MKAVVFHEFGGSDVLGLEEVADPEPGPGEVTLEILACGLNHLDVDIREGISRFPVEPPFILGCEVVGRIAALDLHAAAACAHPRLGRDCGRRAGVGAVSA